MPPKKKPQPPAHVLPTPAKNKEVAPLVPVTSVDQPKRGRGRPWKNPSATCACAICLDAIVEATETSVGEEALFCEGHCQAWLHRRCAFITKARFVRISSSEAPFLCCYCQADTQHLATKLLQDEVAALRIEVAELKDTLQKAESRANCSTSDVRESPISILPEQSTAWSNGVKRGSKLRKQQALKAQKRPPATGNKQVYDWEPANVTAMSRDKQSVSGKRRIWGTLKQCNAEAVKRAIHQFSTLPDGSIEVRRKYKTVKNAKLRWWHVLTAEEENLQILDHEWEGIRLQTGWKIEPCLVFKDNFQSNPVDTNTAPASTVPGSEVGPASARSTVALSTSEAPSAADERAGETLVLPAALAHGVSTPQSPIPVSKLICANMDTPVDNYFLGHN